MVTKLMQCPPRNLISLIESLQGAMLEAQPWQDFLDQLRIAMSGNHISLTFRPIDQAIYTEYFSGCRPPEDVSLLFTSKYHADPLPHRTMKEGAIYTQDTLIQDDDPVQRDFHREILVPAGMAYLHSVRVQEPNGAEAWLSVTKDEDFAPEASDFLLMLVPHFRAAVRTSFALERERFRARVAQDAIHRLNFGWITLNANCRIVEIDPHAEDLFGHLGYLRRLAGNRLSTGSVQADAQISKHLGLIAQDPERARPRAINLSRDPWFGMLLAPIRAPTVPVSPTPVAIAYLNSDHWSSADRCDQLVELFGLLPSEARLAWALTQGMSLTEAAAALGLKRETVRNYSKRIYSKLGARGQVDLVRTILTSVLAIA